MMNVEIMKIGNEEKVVVSSLDVSETFTYVDEETQKEYICEHKSVLRSIRELKCSEEFRGEHYSPSNYVDSRGKQQPCVVMDRDGFTMLLMGFIDPKAIKFKEGYIKQFNAMEKALRGKAIEREKGIAVRQALTKVIQMNGENERMHGYAYSTYTNCIYKILFGMDSKQLREKYNVSNKDTLRNCFTAEELRAIEAMEMIAAGLVDTGCDYQTIKDLLTTHNTKRLICE